MIRVIFSDKGSGTVSDDAELKRQIDLGIIAAYFRAGKWVRVTRSDVESPEKKFFQSCNGRAGGGNRDKET